MTLERAVRDWLCGLGPEARLGVIARVPPWLRRAAREQRVECVALGTRPPVAPDTRGTLDAGLLPELGARSSNWPERFARLHARLREHAPVWIGTSGSAPSSDPRAWLEAAGFERITDPAHLPGVALARRRSTLPDFVRRDLRVLICGLNPSLHAARSGIPFSRPGNRFWPAALRAGLVERDRDPFAALERGIGFTDLCKRPTRRAGELRPAEYARGLAELECKLAALRPHALCFVGLAGWRATVDRQATPGWIPGGFAGRPAYLMPSTSGLNARASPAELSRHLARVYDAAQREAGRHRRV